MMPTKKPRVQVTLNEFTHEVIARMAKLQGQSRGSIISELLDSVAPSLARTVALLDAANSAPDDVKKGLVSVVDKAHEDLISVTSKVNQGMDQLVFDFYEKGAPISKTSTPYTNRGVEKPNKTQERSSASANTRASKRKSKTKKK